MTASSDRVLQVGTDGPRAGGEYSQVLDRGEAAPKARLRVAVIEGFSGGSALRVALEASTGSGVFVTLAEGPLLQEEHLTRGRTLLEADLPAGLPRWVRLRYESTGEHRVGAVFGGLVTSEASNSPLGPVTSSTYSGIAAEIEAQEREIRSRKPGLDAAPALKPGEVPRNAAGIWNDVDRGPPPPLNEEDG